MGDTPGSHLVAVTLLCMVGTQGIECMLDQMEKETELPRKKGGVIQSVWALWFSV